MTIITALPFTLQNGQTADATQVMADFNEIVTDVNNNAAHNGANNDITSLSALVTPVTPAQGGTTVWYGAGAGTANAQTVPTPTPASFALNAGYSIYWVPSVGNTGALTLSVNATTVTAVRIQTGSGLEPLIGGETITGQLAKATFDGTYWVLDLDPMVGFGTLNNLASATTTDLGTALSHSVNITGSVTITSFGSTASLQRPFYKLVFSGAALLTYNVTSLILPGSANITTANGDSAIALYLGSGNWQLVSYYKRNGQALNFAANFLQNYLSGLILTWASTTSFSAAVGEAVDSTNTTAMLLASALTKTTSAWSVGSAAGGLDTGTIATTQWYHVFLMQRPDTGVVDVCFSISPTTPSTGGAAHIPADYTLFRRIGSVRTDGSSHWQGFTQVGDQFLWGILQTADFNGTVASSRQTLTVNVPTGVVVNALLMGSLNATSGTSVNICPLVQTDAAVATNSNTNLQAGNTAIVAGNFNVQTNTSAQIAWRAATASAAVLLIQTYGWIDNRGRLG